MAYKIIWSPESVNTFDRIIEYLNKNWTLNEINNFIDKTERIINLIVKNPYLFRRSEKENIHEALISKHNLLLYQINDSNKHIELLSFWDTRQNPTKKPTRANA